MRVKRVGDPSGLGFVLVADKLQDRTGHIDRDDLRMASVHGTCANVSNSDSKSVSSAFHRLAFPPCSLPQYAVADNRFKRRVKSRDLSD